jgi:uncharacterized protein YndB with AHSA1/START domain
MTVTSVAKNPETMTMTITADFDAPIQRVWRVWEDPRQLERWWGPPTYPATVVDHDLTPGGRVTYFMTGPEGDKSCGWWRILLAEAPHRLEFEDGFANDAGEPNPDMPTMTIRVTLSERSEAATRMVIETSFPSEQAMDQMISMGMDEGMSLAVGQIDSIVAAESSP